MIHLAGVGNRYVFEAIDGEGPLKRFAKGLVVTTPRKAFCGALVPDSSMACVMVHADPKACPKCLAEHAGMRPHYDHVRPLWFDPPSSKADAFEGFAATPLGKAS